MFDPDINVFRIAPIRDISTRAKYIYPNAPGCSPAEPIKCVWLPEYDEAKVLVEKYLSDITYIHHVVHSPSMGTLLDQIYADLDQKHDVADGQVALLLSIIASATYSWTSRDNVGLFPTADEANSQSALWVKATLDVLDHSRRTTSGELEDIQAMIILSFVVCSLEGISRRYRDLCSTAVSLARQISLHRIDDTNPCYKMVCQPNSVQAEIGRRVWWYLAASDWFVFDLNYED